MTDMPEGAMDVKGLCERLEERATLKQWTGDPIDGGVGWITHKDKLLAEAATALTSLSRELAEARAEIEKQRMAVLDMNSDAAAWRRYALAAEAASAAKDERIREAHAFIAKLVHMQSGAGWTRAVVRDAAAEFLRSQGVVVEPGADTTPGMVARSTKEPT